MLYRPTPVDFSRQVAVFVHIPKTAGSALCDALFEQLGIESCVVVKDTKVVRFYQSRLRKRVWRWRQFLRAGFVRQPPGTLVAEGPAPADLGRLKLLEGHYELGGEPRLGREPVYLTTVRDPVQRFLSDYYYRFDQRATWPEGKRVRRAFWTYDLDRFVNYVYERRAWNEINVQCRYLGGADNFAAARRAIDERIFVAAPSNRLDDCLQLLRPVLGLGGPAEAPRSNVGRARLQRPPPSEESLAKIREMVAEDQRLFDYVSAEFDALVRRFAAGAAG